MPTREIINQNLHLRNLTDVEKYVVYDKLARKLEKAVEKYIEGEGVNNLKANNLPTTVKDYLCLNPPGMIISLNNCMNMEEFVKIVASDAWKLDHTTIRDFWKRVKNHRIPGKKLYIRGHNSIETLDTLSIAAGKKNFEDFLESEFNQKERFKVLILPLWGSDEEVAKGLELLRYRFKRLMDVESLPISLEILQEPHSGMIGNLTSTQAQNYGELKGADLVIWGNVHEGSSVSYRIKYHIMDPVLSYKPSFWENRPFTYSYVDLDGYLPNNMDAIIYWCFGIISFKEERYEDAINYFRKILNMNLQEKEEICFRIGVFYDLMEDDAAAAYYYYMSIFNDEFQLSEPLSPSHLSFQEWIQSQSEKPVKDPTSNKIQIPGDLLDKLKISDPDSFKPLNMKLLFFELARIQHSLLLIDRFPKSLIEKFLERSIRNMRKEWFNTDYRELIAEAYFQLARLYTTDGKKMKEISPELIRKTIATAIRLSKREKIHQESILMCQRLGYLKQAIKIVQNEHGADSNLAKRYLDSLNGHS